MGGNTVKGTNSQATKKLGKFESPVSLTRAERITPACYVGPGETASGGSFEKKSGERVDIEWVHNKANAPDAKKERKKTGFSVSEEEEEERLGEGGKLYPRPFPFINEREAQDESGKDEAIQISLFFPFLPINNVYIDSLQF